MLEIKKIHKVYTTDNFKQTALDNVSLNFRESEFVSILGPSGSGKTTLLNIIGGLDKYTSGDLIINGVSTKKYNDRDWDTYRNHKIGFVFQSYNLIPHQTILENVDTKGYSDKDLRTLLGNFLFYGDDVFKKIEVLSPGEKARVALCKIMLERANLLLLDEPTNHLDPDTQKVIGENFKNYEGTIIIVSHNIPFIESINVDRILLLPSGKIINYDKERLEKYIHNTNNN